MENVEYAGDEDTLGFLHQHPTSLLRAFGLLSGAMVSNNVVFNLVFWMHFYHRAQTTSGVKIGDRLVNLI